MQKFELLQAFELLLVFSHIGKEEAAEAEPELIRKEKAEGDSEEG